MWPAAEAAFHGRSKLNESVAALRFHDLRQFAGTMAAAVGASTKEVMTRGG